MQQKPLPPLIPVYSRRHMFAEPERRMIPANQTIAEILRGTPELPSRFWHDGVVTIGDHEIRREYWSMVRPKGCADVSLYLPPEGSSGSVLKLVATVAIIVGATLISGGALAPFATALGFGSSLFAAGSLGGEIGNPL